MGQSKRHQQQQIRRLIPVVGPEIDALLKEKSYFTKAIIPAGGMYRGNPNDTVSIGGKQVLSTNAATDPENGISISEAGYLLNIDRFRAPTPSFCRSKRN